jgi:large subunit ribosomal protein L30
MIKFRIQQTGSPIRRHHSQRETLIGLGLNKIGRIAQVPNTPQTWGMIRKVRHLVRFPDEYLYEQHRLVRPGPVNEALDLELVRLLVFEPRRINVERVDEAKMEGEKSPDFKLLTDGQLQGFCEVKSPRDHSYFEFPKDLKPGEIREQVRRDPAAPNLGLHIVKAAKQFDSVNLDHSVPNVLAIVNHAPGRGAIDLRLALEGFKVPGGGRGFLIF